MLLRKCSTIQLYLSSSGKHQPFRIHNLPYFLNSSEILHKCKFNNDNLISTPMIYSWSRYIWYIDSSTFLISIHCSKSIRLQCRNERSSKYMLLHKKTVLLLPCLEKPRNLNCNPSILNTPYLKSMRSVQWGNATTLSTIFHLFFKQTLSLSLPINNHLLIIRTFP